MWIWISVGAWVVLGICSCLMVWNSNRVNNWTWDSYDVIASILCIILGPMGVFIVLLVRGKDCFRITKGKKMKIYWDKSMQQIKTKDGECLFDLMAYRSRCDKIIELESPDTEVDEYNKGIDANNAKIEAENREYMDYLRCAAKTQGKHKMMFQKSTKGTLTINMIQGYCCGQQNSPFIFKCLICGLEITKTEKELTPTEKEALKKLKLL